MSPPSRPIVRFDNKYTTIDWDTGNLLSVVQFSPHPDESPDEDERLRQASVDLRQRGFQFRWVDGYGPMFHVIAKYPATLPQLCHATRCVFLGYEPKRNVAEEDAAWRLEVDQDVRKSQSRLWENHHNLMTYTRLQPKHDFMYGVTLHQFETRMMLMRSIRVHKYEVASKCISSTWVDDLSRTQTYQAPSWAEGRCMEDLLLEQHYRCIQDVEKLQAILELDLR